MVGIDIVQLSRVQLKDSFVHYVLTESEIEEYNNRPENSKKEYLAGRFACKEAIYKATQDKDFLKYSILTDNNGRPYVAGHEEMEVSISHDGDYAIAIVVIY